MLGTTRVAELPAERRAPEACGRSRACATWEQDRESCGLDHASVAPMTKGRTTHVLELPAAMPVRTLTVTVAAGPERGLSWAGERATLGTAQDNAVVLSDATVSGYHARVASVADGIAVTDFGSTNGTYWEGARLVSAVVPAGAALRLGKTTVVVDHCGPPAFRHDTIEGTVSLLA